MPDQPSRMDHPYRIVILSGGAVQWRTGVEGSAVRRRCQGSAFCRRV